MTHRNRATGQAMSGHVCTVRFNVNSKTDPDVPITISFSDSAVSRRHDRPRTSETSPSKRRHCTPRTMTCCPHRNFLATAGFVDVEGASLGLLRRRRRDDRCADRRSGAARPHHSRGRTSGDGAERMSVTNHRPMSTISPASCFLRFKRMGPPVDHRAHKH